jgi:hypothetical protein
LVNKNLKTERSQVFVCYDLLERLIYEEGDLIFETEPKLFSIGIITISHETVSLLSTRVSKVKINGKSNLEQITSDQGAT